jgi:hypothetical protein
MMPESAILRKSSKRTDHMKRITVLAIVAIASQAVAILAGEPVVSSKQVIALPPPGPERSDVQFVGPEE